ncbi:MAG TPA: sterol desaturase family protein [Puia sp.]|jgi:sterol desaturase/sphingolipid hydroxylase (fatty acid hydroxylase superfamily)
MPPALLYYAIPGFVLLLSIEAWFSYREQKGLYETRDTFSSLALGIGNVVTGLITKGLIFGLFMLLYRWRLFTLDGSHWWHWALAFFADDLSYYWFHRESHHINWFWASHVVHHSSQKYNLAAALRQTWTGNLTGAFLFWCWMPLVGFHPIIVLTMQSISLIYQFWIHTEAIRKLPRPIEFIFNTPSHHRVHHGVNLRYLDKNHAGVLVIWDRLFGTFQPEEEKPVYGLTRNIGSFNPVIVATKTWGHLFGKAVRSRSWKKGFQYFLRPPGWSHDGSSQTTREIIDGYNREHPESPIH